MADFQLRGVETGRRARQGGIATTVAVALVAASCTGQIGADEAGGAPGPGGNGPGTSAGPIGAVPPAPGSMEPGQVMVPPVPPPPMVTSCGTVDPGFVGLRRLTRVEYDNTVRDLLGDTSRPAVAFPSDDSVVADLTQVSTLFFEKHEAAVEKMVNDAWAREVAGMQPATAKLMVCPLKAGDTACARNIVTSFARKAWRRPVTAAELDPYFKLLDVAQMRGDDISVGVKLGLQTLLLAPEFLFRMELDARAGSRNLTAHELAVRLSYMLWSSTPDARLMEVADSGALLAPATLGSEMTRMLGDPKAMAFAENFVAHWLSLGSLAAAQPNPMLFPGFDEPMRHAMAGETIQLFRAFLNEGHHIRDIVDADFSFVNDRLAKHYGLTLPTSNAPAGDLRRVSMPAGPRRGVLGHAGILTMTSGPTATSPVKRGKFVLSQLLCSKPPPPPPGADNLPKEAVEAKTERERLAIHRANPQCAACHALMDPIGLGLENFDFVGRHRTKYENGAAIDTSGQLVGGGSFTTLEELRGLVKTDERIPACVAKQLFVYAIGRETAPSDECVQKSIVDRFAGTGKLSDLLSALAGSPPFMQRRAESAGGSP